MIATITIQQTINSPVKAVWEKYTKPEHIVNWNNASPDWHTPKATNDLRVGGKFLSRMEAKDKSAGFDFTGTYTYVKQYEQIAYKMDDGRKVIIVFEPVALATKITIAFDPETINPVEMQRGGWQAILDNFKKYVESSYQQ